MTIRQIADELKVSVSVVKLLLRSEFPDGGTFTSPDCSLDLQQIQRTREEIRRYIEQRRKGQGAVSPTPIDIELPATSELSERLPFAEVVSSVGKPSPGIGHRLWLHQDVLELLKDPRQERRLQSAVQRLMREMLVEGRAQRRVKGTRGINSGWLRAPLGDNGGSHYYLWHALMGAPPVKAMELCRGDVLLRAVLHHDAIKDKVSAGDLESYLHIQAMEYVEELETPESADVLSTMQREACEREEALSISKGHPGAGKTTLQLERARRYRGRVLFVTFGEAQCEQARSWLETFAPKGQAPQAWTHERLFRELDPTWQPAPSLAEATSILEAAVESARALGPWAGKVGTLHAELRAQLWGKAVGPASQGRYQVLSPEQARQAYQERRAVSLGDQAVRSAAEVAGGLASDIHERLFGDLERMQRLVEQLQRGAVLPSSLDGLDALLVDEVQDLTFLEQLVIVLVARISGKSIGKKTAFHAAGDEGQTVRATDFEWGALKTLIDELLGRPVEHDLPGNLRSPSTITKVVNNSWGLYKSIAKRQRPKGYAEAEVDETSLGSVLWVERGDNGLEELCRIIAATPGAALVYPGASLPGDVREAAGRAGISHAASASELKGLDFRVAFVLDVGRRAHELFSEVSKTNLVQIIELENRIAVDAIRVAISRATEVLVFVERRLGRDERARLEMLCRDGEALLEGVVTEVAMEDLESRLDIDTSDRYELVTDALNDFDRTFSDDPAAGLRIAERARGWLGDSSRAASVKGELRRMAYQRLGLAQLRAAIDADPQDVESYGRANATLNQAKEPEQARFALSARNLVAEKDWKAGLLSITDASRSSQDPLASYATLVLEKLLRRTSEQSPGKDSRKWDRHLEMLEGTAEGARCSSSLAALHHLAVERTGEWVLAMEESKAGSRRAAKVLALMKQPEAEQAGRLAERAEQWAVAIAHYREAGIPGEALRVSRGQGEDDQLSLLLAKEAGAADAKMLERLVRLRADVAALEVDALTDNERVRLAVLVKPLSTRR